MKKIFLMLLATISLMACDKGNDSKNPPPPDSGTITTTVYADEIEKKNAISFTAPHAWTATISDIKTRAENNNVEWLQLSVYSGSAGKQSISISLMPNFTGTDRKAEVKITSGETIITIIVEQKATTKENKAPQYKTVKRMNIFHNGKSDGYIEFTYDNQQRIIAYNNFSNENKPNDKVMVTYSGSQVKVIDIGEENTNYTYNLDKNGRVASWEQLFNNAPSLGNYTYDIQGRLTMYPQGVEVNSSNTGSGSTETYRYVYAHNTWDGLNIKTTIIDQGHEYPRESNYEYTEKLNNGLASIDITGGYKGEVFIILKEGSFGKKNKNLIKRETGSFTRDWSYEFDNDGNMTKFSISNTGEYNDWTEDYEIIYN